MSSPEQTAVSLTISSLFRDVELKIGGIRITMSAAAYHSTLHEIDRELAARNLQAEKLHESAKSRWKEVHQAVKELREVIYEQEGDFFILRDKPDEKLLNAFLDKYAALMGFE